MHAGVRCAIGSRPVQTAEHRPLTDEERAPIEAEDGLRQFDRLMEIVEENLERLRHGPCGGGIVGTQVCEDDGLKFGKCDCSAAGLVDAGLVDARLAADARISVDARMVDALVPTDAGAPGD